MTDFAAIENDMEAAPAGTVTDAGKVAAAGLLLARVTVTGVTAAPARLTTPKPLPPLMSVGGTRVIADRLTGGATVRVADLVTPFKDADITGVFVLVTARLVTGNVALNPVNVMEEGTVAAVVSLLLSMTVTGNVSVAVSVTVAMLLPTPPSTRLGDKVTEAGANAGSSGLTVITAFLETLFKAAVITEV